MLSIYSVFNCDKVYLEISQNSQENTCARVSFNKDAGLRPFSQNASWRLLLNSRNNLLSITYSEQQKYSTPYNLLGIAKILKYSTPYNLLGIPEILYSV